MSKIQDVAYSEITWDPRKMGPGQREASSLAIMGILFIFLLSFFVLYQEVTKSYIQEETSAFVEAVKTAPAPVEKKDTASKL